MDDQQHAISALLAITPVLDPDAGASDEPTWSAAGARRTRCCGWSVAAVVVANPFRPRPERPGWQSVAVGVGAAGALVVLLRARCSTPSRSARRRPGRRQGAPSPWRGRPVLVAPAASATVGIVAAGSGLAALALGADDGAVVLAVVASAGR